MSESPASSRAGVAALARAVRAGLVRGGIELRNTFSNAEELTGYIVPLVLLLLTMVFTRHLTVPGTNFSLGSRMLPWALGMGVVFSGLSSVAAALLVEREDGTLLRAKAIPNGMTGYLVGKITSISGVCVISMVVQLIPGLLFFPGYAFNTVGAWLTLVWVLLLGLAATMPLGAVVGSLFSSPRNLGLVVLPLMGLIATSGLFYPITNFPQWLQWLAQAFPVYWLGLGMRSALLPASMASVEMGGSWRHWETFGVLGAWAIVGLLVAPIVLRRMARRESGSAVQERRERALQRVR